MMSVKRISLTIIGLVLSIYLFSQKLQVQGEQIIHANEIDHTIETVLEDDQGRLWFLGFNKPKYNFHKDRSLILGFYDGQEFFYKDIPGFGPFLRAPILHMRYIGENEILIYSYSPGILLTFNLKEDSMNTLFKSDDTEVLSSYSISGDTLFYAVSTMSIDNKNIPIYSYLDGKSQKLFEVPYLESNFFTLNRHKGSFFISYAGQALRYATDGTLLSTYQMEDFESYKISDNSIASSLNNLFLWMVEARDTLVIRQSFTSPTTQFYDEEEDRFYAYKTHLNIPILMEVFSDRKGISIVWDDLKKDSSSILLFTKDNEVIDLSQQIGIHGYIISITGNDLSKDLWVTHKNGVHKYQFLNARGNIILDKESIRQILPYKRNQFLITTEYSGWYIFDFQKHKVKSISERTGKKIEYSRGVYYMKDSTLVSNNNNRIIEITTPWKYKEVISLPEQPQSSVLFSDSLILYGYSIGLLQVYNIYTHEIKTFQNIPDIGVIHNIQKLDSRKVFLASDKGLYLYDLKMQEVLSSDESIGGVYTMEVADNKFYLGTTTGNLLEIILENEDFHLEDITSVPSSISTITFDKEDRIWLATYFGLYVLDRQTDSLYRYSDSHLSHYEFNRFSHYYDSLDNRLFLGTVNGLNFFHFNNNEKIKHHIYLTQYEYFNSEDKKVIKTQLPPNGQYIKIPPGKNYFKIDYRSDLNFQDEYLSYEYKIDGSEWTDNYKNVQLSFPNLSKGIHLLKIRAKNGSSTLSENTLTLHIDVQKFFYETGWFFILIFFLIAAVISLWIKRILTENKRMELEVLARTKELRDDKVIIEKQALDLQDLNKTKALFFANISHELKTPLTLISSPLKSILADDSLPLGIRPKIQRINLSVQTLKNRIDELLELAEMEDGRLTLDNRLFKLDETIQDMIDVFIDIAAEKNVEYKPEIKLPAIHVKSDSKKLIKIFQNLIFNAIKFTPAGGIIEVNIGWEKDILFFKIKDTGIGIPESEKERIFDMFYQPEQGSLNHAPGHGIGLALVMRYVHLFNGNIDMQSGINVGTVFTVSIPLKAVDAHNIVRHPELATQRYEPTGREKELTVLLVEDNKDLSEYILSLIGQYYICLQADNGKEAISILNKRPVDLVISDIMMPEMDGIKLFEKMRKNQRFDKIPVLFLTANSNVRLRVQSYTLGVNDFMLKPFEEDELLIRISNLLRNYRTRLETRLKNESDIVENDVEKHKLNIHNIQNEIFENLKHPEFSVHFLAHKFFIHERTLARFIKKETGLTPSDLIQEARYLKAKELLENRVTLTVAETVEAIGLKNQSYFSRKFKERFGFNPSDLT